MRYLSVCSGIEAATVAWHPLGWEAAAFSEIEKFPRAVLQHHYPDVPLHGDFTTIGADEYGPIDLLVGGTPCQSFSIAGLRGGLADDRGNLALEFLKLAQRTRAKWLVWENVPGVLSSDGGRDFGSILGGMVELGYGFAYRVLDAQFFGVPQRRRRVFVVGYLGDWRRAAAVLFERHSLQGNPAPRREAGQGTAATIKAGFSRCWNDAENNDNLIAHSLRGEGFDASEDGTGRGTPLVTVDVADTLTSNGDAHSGYRDEKGLVAFSIMPMNSGKDYKARETDVAQPIMAGGPVGGNQGGDFIAYGSAVKTTGHQGDNVIGEGDVWPCLSRSGGNNGGGGGGLAHIASAVRRLTPRECERLQGFPDNFTQIPWRGKPASDCPDGPRYKALGNSMAVPVMRWIGERIAAVEALSEQRKAA